MSESLNVCQLDSEVEIIYSSETHGYILGGVVNGNGRKSRHLASRRSLLRSGDVSMAAAAPNNHSLSFFHQETTPNMQNDNVLDSKLIYRKLGDEYADPGNIIYGRRCLCAPDDTNLYCPAEATVCRLNAAPDNSSYRIQCEIKMNATVDRFLLFLSLFMIIFFIILLVGSPKGRYALKYARKLLFVREEARYHRELRDELQRMAEHERDQRTRLRNLRMRYPNRVYLPRQGPTLGSLVLLAEQQLGPNERASTQSQGNANHNHADESSNLYVVVLKTRNYQPREEEDQTTTTLNMNEDSLKEACAICLLTFERGDRVADIPCRHLFHTRCLKTWIQRKNHCPLCLSQDLAKPQKRQDDKMVEMTTTATTTATIPNESPSLGDVPTSAGEIPETDA